MPPGFISSGLKMSSDVRRRLHISANTWKILFCGWVGVELGLSKAVVFKKRVSQEKGEQGGWMELIKGAGAVCPL